MYTDGKTVTRAGAFLAYATIFSIAFLALSFFLAVTRYVPAATPRLACMLIVPHLMSEHRRALSCVTAAAGRPTCTSSAGVGVWVGVQVWERGGLAGSRICLSLRDT